MNVIRIATVNINAIRNATRVDMLKEFLRYNDLDIVLLQEVATQDSTDIPGYVAYNNIGPDMRGTAIMARRSLSITKLERLPSGRAMAIECAGLRVVNLYAPSGTAKRKEREYFYNSEVPLLLTAQNTPTLVGGDFNCVLAPCDSTGTLSRSNALANIVSGLRLSDAWQQDPRRPMYTHHSPSGASRIDRFYLSPAAAEKKVGIETVPVAFTDHHAVIIRMEMQTGERRRRAGRWKMDPKTVTGARFTEALQTEWKKWTSRRRHYPELGWWWERCVKPNIRRLARQVESEERRSHKMMEDHLHECLLDILKADIPEEEKRPVLQKYKAKLVRLNARKRENLLLDTQPQDRMDAEDMSLYHLIKIAKRRTAREITQITDEQGHRQTTAKGIAATLVQHYAHAFRPIPVDSNAMQC